MATPTKPGRQFLRVANFDEMQNPKRPKRPTWIKSFVRDLDDPDRLMLSLAVRGFLSEFEKLAAQMLNRVPNDVRFIARKVNAPPRVVGKTLHACVTHGFITVFDEDVKTSRINDLYQKTDTRTIPPSNSNSHSSSHAATLKGTANPRPSSPNDSNDDFNEVDLPF